MDDDGVFGGIGVSVGDGIEDVAVVDLVTGTPGGPSSDLRGGGILTE